MHALVGGREGVVAGQQRLAVAAGEMDRAGVAGDRLPRGVGGRDCNVEGRPRAGTGRGGDAEERGLGIERRGVAQIGEVFRAVLPVPEQNAEHLVPQPRAFLPKREVAGSCQREIMRLGELPREHRQAIDAPGMISIDKT